MWNNMKLYRYTAITFLFFLSVAMCNTKLVTKKHILENKKHTEFSSLLIELNWDMGRVNSDIVTIKKINSSLSSDPQKNWIDVKKDGAGETTLERFYYDRGNIYTGSQNFAGQELEENTRVRIFHIYNLILRVDQLGGSNNKQEEVAYKDRKRILDVPGSYFIEIKERDLEDYVNLMEGNLPFNNKTHKVGKKLVGRGPNVKNNESPLYEFYKLTRNLMPFIWPIWENDRLIIYIDFIELKDPYACYKYSSDRAHENIQGTQIECQHLAANYINWENYYTFYKNNKGEIVTNKDIMGDSDIKKLYRSSENKFVLFFLFLYLNNNKQLNQESPTMNGNQVTVTKNLKMMYPLWENETMLKEMEPDIKALDLPEEIKTIYNNFIERIK